MFIYVAVGAAVATVGSSIISSNAISDAADTAAAASDAAVGTEWDMFVQTQANQQPWLDAGTRALTTLEDMTNAGPGEFTADPGYQFGLDEGNKNILANASATGSLASGKTLKALEEYGQDYATNEYDNFLSRYYKSLTPYQSIAGVGQTTASDLADTGTAVASSIADTTIAAGDARASGYIDQANVATSTGQSLANLAATYYGNTSSSGSSGSSGSSSGTWV